jgi:class 3 adenylate cyclase/tetratricopeptide (TPR) repeat protein
VITGPGASMTVEMETVADAGEIALSPRTAAALDAGCIGEPKGPALLLKRAPRVSPEPSAPVEDVNDLPVEHCLPTAVREHLLAGGGEAEHRTLTAAFIQFTGADDMLVREGPKALSAALAQCVGTVQRICSEHGVAFFETDIAPGGGKIMLIAGAPTTSGNDEERMLRALRAIIDAAGPLPLGIGVHRGRIFVGDFGPPYRRTYSVTGDAINLAARVMARAEPGQVLATSDVLARSRTEFDVVALEPFKAKGKAEPVRAFAVGAAKGARKAVGAATPLIGREAELATLVGALKSAREFEGQLVEIVGEPGMGKSRLLEELRAHAGADEVFSVQCDEYEAATPYFAFRELLRELLGLRDGEDRAESAKRLRRRVKRLAPHLLPWLPLLAVPIGLELPDTPETRVLEEQFRKTRLEEATRELIGMLRLFPSVFVFEDAHWMDDASSDLLRELVRRLADRAWLVVVTRRDQPTGFRGTGELRRTVLQLEPLAPEQAAALVEAATEELPLPRHQVAALAERAGGNPLFLTELLEAARSAGDFGELPDSVETLMAAQIDRLSPGDRRVLRCASVIGASFAPDLLELCLGAERPDGDIWTRLADLVVDDGAGQVRFRHALVRDAAYEGLPYRRRRELHAAVGETIERRAGRTPEEEAEHLSLHFFHAHHFDRAWLYSRLAGERAQALYANVEAATFFARALAAGKHLPEIPPRELARVSEALGDVSDRAGDYRKAEEAFRTARRLLGGRPVDEARLLWKQAWIPERLGRYSQAIRWIHRAEELLKGLTGEDAARQRAQLSAWYASIRYHQGRYHEMIRSCRQAIEEAELSGERNALALAYCLLDYAYVALGRPEEASYSHQALSIYEELGNLQRQATVLNDLGAFAYWQGRWDEATQLYERSRELRERIGNPVYAADGTNNIAEVLVDQGRLAEAEPLVLTTLRVFRAADFKARIAVSKRYLGRIAAYSGRFEEAQTLLEEARRAFLDIGARIEVNETEGRLAECLLLQGDGPAALGLLGKALERAEQNGFERLPMLKRLYAHGLAQTGDLEGAERVLREALEAARARGMEFETALALDGLVRLDWSGERAAERDVIFERLGVVSVPEIPIGGVPAAVAAARRSGPARA